MKEVKKCVPLCANCHRERHALLAKLDKAPEYESGDSESSNLSQGTIKVIDNKSLENILKEMYPNQHIERVSWTEGPTLRTIMLE